MKPDLGTYLTLLLFLIWIVAVVKLHAQWQWHHAYFGVLAISPEVPLWLRIPGFICLADDTVQHITQLFNPSYRSPLHLLARALHII